MDIDYHSLIREIMQGISKFRLLVLVLKLFGISLTYARPAAAPPRHLPIQPYALRQPPGIGVMLGSGRSLSHLFPASHWPFIDLLTGDQ